MPTFKLFHIFFQTKINLTTQFSKPNLVNLQSFRRFIWKYTTPKLVISYKEMYATEPVVIPCHIFFCKVGKFILPWVFKGILMKPLLFTQFSMIN